MPEVSVVITTFNRAHYLEEAIHSVLNQTFEDFEVIVVDDGSTDNTQEVVMSLANPKIKYIFQKNQGAGATRNTGIRASTGRLIALLDSDDLWLPEKLELQIKALQVHPQSSVVYTNMFFFGQIDSGTPETFFRLLQWPPPRGKVLDKMVTRSFGHPSTLLIKKEVFTEIGLFDENLPYCDDYDMLIRLAARFEFEVVPLPLVKYRFHSNQISRNPEPVFENHITVFQKAGRLPGIGKDIHQKLNSRLADFHFRYAVFLFRRLRPGKGLKELLASIKADRKRFFLSFLVLGKSISRYAFGHLASIIQITKGYSASRS